MNIESLENSGLTVNEQIDVIKSVNENQPNPKN